MSYHLPSRSWPQPLPRLMRVMSPVLTEFVRKSRRPPRERRPIGPLFVMTRYIHQYGATYQCSRRLLRRSPTRRLQPCWKRLVTNRTLALPCRGVAFRVNAQLAELGRVDLGAPTTPA